ncbi:MAG: hypothetical protein H7343_15630 [Undibacterium sp.]|nr:hypothetical protein [Opitutaceae bacterium]
MPSQTAMTMRRGSAAQAPAIRKKIQMAANTGRDLIKGESMGFQFAFKPSLTPVSAGACWQAMNDAACERM